MNILIGSLRSFDRRLRYTSVLIILCSCLISCGGGESDHSESSLSNNFSAAEVMEEFEAWDGAEDTLMDPLIIAGDQIVPYVLSEIVDESMPKRRYAIGALGNIGDASAIPVLESIALDPSELNFIRCDCVQAVALIDWDEGKRVARSISSALPHTDRPSDNCLPTVVREIVEGEHRKWLSSLGIARSVEDARVRRHD